MRQTILSFVLLVAGATASPKPEPIVPERVNLIFGAVRPHMSEADLVKLIRSYYPKATLGGVEWSGTTGNVEFKLDERYSIGVAEYNAPKDFNSKFVHESTSLSLYDYRLKRRIDFSFHSWAETKSDGEGKK